MDAQDFKAWRSQRGLTQEKAGESLGVSRRVVAGWETDTISMPKMVALATWAIDQGQRLLQSN
jgi:transcriptional regulator with XRE-family HTH domain